MYIPIHVGREGKCDLGYVGDNTGDNISQANPRLCELTGMYWAWKNLKADYIGMMHYRRYFTEKSIPERLAKGKYASIISQKELEPLLNKYDLVLPKQRRYYIESLYSHFVHLPYTYEKDIGILRDIIGETCPEYLEAFDKVMKRSHAHMFNIFVMKKECFDRYCQWFFSVILEADRRIDVSGYTAMEARAVAFLGEFLLDVWNEKQKIVFVELPVMFMEKQNWAVKGGSFLIRKIAAKTGRAKKESGGGNNLCPSLYKGVAA